MNLLVEAVSNVTDWHTLGLKLGLTMSQLDEIEDTYRRVGRRKAEMFDVWLKSSPNASWADLITALKSMNEYTVASEIAVHYSEQSLTAGKL